MPVFKVDVSVETCASHTFYIEAIDRDDAEAFAEDSGDLLVETTIQDEADIDDTSIVVSPKPVANPTRVDFRTESLEEQEKKFKRIDIDVLLRNGKVVHA